MSSFSQSSFDLDQIVIKEDDNLHNRIGLRAIVASAMSLGTMMNDPLMRHFGLLPRIKARTSSRVWTCKKCHTEFHPHLSPTLCDDCIRRRDRR